MPLKPSSGSTTTTAAPPTFASRATAATAPMIATRRPWRELLKISSLSFPLSYGEAISRIKHNYSYFRVNYTMVIFSIMFLSLIWRPVPMIVFIVVFIAWFFLHFNRYEPVVVLGVKFDERIVLVGLCLVSGLAVGFTHVGLNFLVALIVGVFVVGVHGAFRKTEDLFLDEESAVEGGLLSVVVGS